MHLLPFYLRLENRREAFLPEKLVADFPEEPGRLPFTVPSAIQKFTSDVVLFFPDADAGDERVPFFLAGRNLLLQTVSILPYKFE